MFKLTTAQIVDAGEVAWGDFPSYIDEEFLPIVAYLCQGNLDSFIFDVILIAMIEIIIPEEDKELVMEGIPTFIRNLGMGENGELAIKILPKKIW